MERIFREGVKNGKDMNEMLKMPMNFMMEILKEENNVKAEKKESMIDAFT